MRKNKALKKSHQKADDRKRIVLAKKGLWVGGLLVALFVSYVALRSTGSHSSQNLRSFDATGKYIRRETKPTLSPALFVGKTASAYLIAQEIPDALDHLYCYCYCDKSIGHLTLLSCFTDTHAATCGVCQNEAIDAAAMLKQGMALDKIRHQIDLKYGRA